MPIPALVQAAMITAGGALAGGAMSDRSARISASKQRQMDIEFAKNQIQWKVADAKKAGLHPLYALGASGSYAPTNIIQGQSTTGSQLGAAASAIGDMVAQSAHQKKQLAAQAPLIQAQVNAANQAAGRDFAESALALSRQKRVEQEILNESRPPPLYKFWHDNINGGIVPIPDQDSGLEQPELVGGYYLGKGFAGMNDEQRRARGAAKRAATRQWFKDNFTWERKYRPRKRRQRR
jgi:hypothetical protein